MYIKNLIADGEGQQLDFKFNISSAPKIAKTLVAFANTSGGRLLVGVKDNGHIVGVESEEEVFMIELAAERFCNPLINVDMTSWIVDGKTVLEVFVPQSAEKPHYAKDENGKWMVYIRKADENHLADRVLTEVFKRRKENKNTIIRYQKPEKALMDYLKIHKKITFPEFCRIADIPPKLAEKILINLISISILHVDFSGQQNYYVLNQNMMD